MKKMLLGLATIAFLAATVGCANGPFSSCFRGSKCDTCNPPMGQPCNSCSGGCESGACSTGTGGNGFLGSMFRPQNGSVSAPPASIPAASFQQSPASFTSGSPGMYGNSTEYYGNSGNAGGLELPPAGPYN